MTSSRSSSIQQVIQALSSFWVERSCAQLPPCSLEIPAALLHPKTFFRLLEPRPWRGVIAQPVNRPVDGRRGRHPFRTSLHLQLQVALQRPDPATIRDDVVESLRHLGLDPAHHHLRLDSWRWQLEAVGCHGLGWRITLDGVGIGRITFLDRLADQPLPQDRVDITYGVERLALVSSGVDSIFRLPWHSQGDEALRYDQLRRTDEEEQSRYLEEVANVGHLRQILDGLEREARRCLQVEMVRPAYERAIQCLAVLDVLDVRRDLTDREREEWTAAVRQVVAGAARIHLERQSTETKTIADTEPVAPATVKKAATRSTKSRSKRSSRATEHDEDSGTTTAQETPNKPRRKRAVKSPKKPPRRGSRKEPTDG
ncbi:MAG: glycine--tRNA ligase subunit alpha [Thermoanaerobaculia bacterium]|nr:glycine--tRNA ligase subunit alpha [Thermoanaerobaculia bacterium]